MTWKTLARVGMLAVLAWSTQNASAATQSVFFNHLTESATVAPALHDGDTLFLDTLVTTETGALSQSVTFTLGSDIGVVDGFNAWEISTAAGSAPRLVGVNIDIFDSANSLVFSDTFAGVLAGFAHSLFDHLPIGPGIYKLVATGTGVRDSSLDVSLTFATAVPEPQTYALMLAGLGLVGFAARRRK